MENHKYVYSYCEEKHVPLETKEFLLGLPSDCLSAIVSLTKELLPSSNSLRTILELLNDISHRDCLKIGQVLDKVCVDSIYLSSGSKKDKLFKLRADLERLRYPEKTLIESKLENLVLEVKSRYGVKLELPRDLEGDQLQVVFSFRNPEGLEKLGSNMLDLCKSQELTEIFSVLKGEC